MKLIDANARTLFLRNFGTADGYHGYFGAPNNIVSMGSRLAVSGPKQFGACMEVADSASQTEGSGGGILFAGRWDSALSVTACAGIQAYKENATPGSFAFGLMLMTRTDSDGAATNRWRIKAEGHFVSMQDSLSIGESTDRVGAGYFGAIFAGNATGITLDNPFSNLIMFNGVGGGAPTIGVRSLGTKVVLWPSLGASSVDYAIGIGSSTMWCSVAANSTGHFFKWYGGTTEWLSLSGGNLIMGEAGLGTGDTNGFLYIRAMTGAPTGTPSAYAGRVPMVYDTTSNQFYIYNGGWRKVALT